MGSEAPHAASNATGGNLLWWAARTSAGGLPQPPDPVHARLAAVTAERDALAAKVVRVRALCDRLAFRSCPCTLDVLAILDDPATGATAAPGAPQPDEMDTHRHRTALSPQEGTE